MPEDPNTKRGLVRTLIASFPVPLWERLAMWVFIFMCAVGWNPIEGLVPKAVEAIAAGG
jgi:hypothetical protein